MDLENETKPERGSAGHAGAASVALLSLVLFFVAPMLGGAKGIWLMPASIGAASILLRALTTLRSWRIVRLVSIGLFAGVAIDLVVRGIPVFSISGRWDWLAEVLLSAILGLLAALLGVGLAALISRLFSRRSV